MYWELLDRYLTGSCDSEEREEVDLWLAESAGRRNVLEQIARALEQTPPEALDVVRRRLVRGFSLESRSVSVGASRPHKARTSANKESTSPSEKKSPDREKKKSARRSKKASERSVKKKPNRRKKKGQ